MSAERYVLAVAYDAGSRTLAAAMSDHTIILHDQKTLTQRQTLHSHTGRINQLSFAPSAPLLYSATSDRTVQVWNCASPGSAAMVAAFRDP